MGITIPLLCLVYCRTRISKSIRREGDSAWVRAPSADVVVTFKVWRIEGRTKSSISVRKDGRLRHPTRTRGCHGSLFIEGGGKFPRTSRPAFFNMLHPVRSGIGGRTCEILVKSVVGDTSIDRVVNKTTAWRKKGGRVQLSALQWHAFVEYARRRGMLCQDRSLVLDCWRNGARAEIESIVGGGDRGHPLLMGHCGSRR